MPKFAIKRAELERLRACDLAFFDKHGARIRGGAIEYPNGWTPQDTARVAKDDPIALLWLVSRGIVPVAPNAARAAVKQAHGKSADKVFLDFKERGARVTSPDGHAVVNTPTDG